MAKSPLQKVQFVGQQRLAIPCTTTESAAVPLPADGLAVAVLELAGRGLPSSQLSAPSVFVVTTKREAMEMAEKEQTEREPKGTSTTSRHKERPNKQRQKEAPVAYRKKSNERIVYPGGPDQERRCTANPLFFDLIIPLPAISFT